MPPRLRRGDGKVTRHVLVEDVGGGRPIGPVDLDLHVEAAGPQDGRIEEIGPVRGADDDDIAQPFYTIDLGEELRDDRRLHVGRDAAPACSEERVHLVEEDHHRHVVRRFLLRLLEHFAELPLGFADVLVEQLRPLDVQEVAVDRFAALLRELLRQAIRQGLGDHGLAASGRPVEQHALRGAELVLLVEIGVEVRQLHGVLDGLNLGCQTSDVAIADVRDLFECEVFDVGLW